MHCLFNDTEDEINTPRRFEGFDIFQVNLEIVQMLKEAQTLTEQHRHNTNMQFINEARFEGLLREAGPADDGDISVTRRNFGLPQGALHALRDEDE